MLYKISLTVGITALLLTYTVFFPHLSETFLVNLTPLWFFPIVFGGYGIAAMTINREQLESNQTGVTSIPRQFGLLGILLSLPLLFSIGKSPLRAALLGIGYGFVLLVVFFSLIFPAL